MQGFRNIFDFWVSRSILNGYSIGWRHPVRTVLPVISKKLRTYLVKKFENLFGRMIDVYGSNRSKELIRNPLSKNER